MLRNLDKVNLLYLAVAFLLVSLLGGLWCFVFLLSKPTDPLRTKMATALILGVTCLLPCHRRSRNGLRRQNIHYSLQKK
jgi:hypothetical protein